MRLSDGTVTARAAGAGALRIVQRDRPIRRGKQQQEEGSLSLVLGSGSNAFKTLHENIPRGRANTPSPSPAALLHDHFKKWKLIGIGNHGITPNLDFGGS